MSAARASRAASWRTKCGRSSASTTRSVKNMRVRSVSPSASTSLSSPSSLNFISPPPIAAISQYVRGHALLEKLFGGHSISISIGLVRATHPGEIAYVGTLALSSHRRKTRHAQSNDNVDLVLPLELVETPPARAFVHHRSADRQPHRRIRIQHKTAALNQIVKVLRRSGQVRNRLRKFLDLHSTSALQPLRHRHHLERIEINLAQHEALAPFQDRRLDRRLEVNRVARARRENPMRYQARDIRLLVVAHRTQRRAVTLHRSVNANPNGQPLVFPQRHHPWQHTRIPRAQ